MAKAKGKTKAKKETVIEIVAIRKKEVIIMVKSSKGSSLISHRFAASSIKDIEDKQQKKVGAVTKRQRKRNPTKEYEESLYEVKGKLGVYGFPADGFKAALIKACTFTEQVKTEMKGSIYVFGNAVCKYSGRDLIILENAKPKMRTDTVTIGSSMSKSTDIRYRGEFVKWEAKIRVVFNSVMITIEQLINLFSNAGFGAGIGDWRPGAPKTAGNHGMFDVVGVSNIVNLQLPVVKHSEVLKKKRTVSAN